jgi:hypothetical protein
VLTIYFGQMALCGLVLSLALGNIDLDASRLHTPYTVMYLCLSGGVISLGMYVVDMLTNHVKKPRA